jgi:superfamily II DNA or RNA helicase
LGARGSTTLSLRQWQEDALVTWRQQRSGIIEVVTGGGKTVFALACVREAKADTTLIVVPTTALLDQWWEEAANFFGFRLDDIHIISGAQRMRSGTINIAVLNTASKLASENRTIPCFLVVDECHKAASPTFRAVLDIPKIATLGLSATPERPYDEGLAEVLVPALGPVIYKYTYREALRDGVIVPFSLRNIVFELEEDDQKAYDKLTGSIARSISKLGIEAQETISLLLRRARLLNLVTNRIRLTLKIISSHRDRKIIVFHEDIHACNLIQQVLEEANVRSGVYHSALPLRRRAEVLSAYRAGALNVLVTCRALDEGFNVPETEIGIIAASTATRRQRIQRLGRVLRPTSGKEAATVFTLVATGPEINRLKEEETELEGVADVTWSSA